MLSLSYISGFIAVSSHAGEMLCTYQIEESQITIRRPMKDCRSRWTQNKQPIYCYTPLFWLKSALLWWRKGLLQKFQVLPSLYMLGWVLILIKCTFWQVSGRATLLRSESLIANPNYWFEHASLLTICAKTGLQYFLGLPTMEISVVVIKRYGGKERVPVRSGAWMVDFSTFMMYFWAIEAEHRYYAWAEHSVPIQIELCMIWLSSAWANGIKLWTEACGNHADGSLLGRTAKVMCPREIVWCQCLSCR